LVNSQTIVRLFFPSLRIMTILCYTMVKNSINQFWLLNARFLLSQFLLLRYTNSFYWNMLRCSFTII